MTPPMEERRALLANPDIAEAITRRATITGRPRKVYETYLISDPRPGRTWESVIHGRMTSLMAGPPTEEMKAEVRRMVTPNCRDHAA